MSSTEPDPPTDGPDLAAAEYVLGVLDAHDYAAATRRAAADPAFAAEVTAWEARLMPLIAEIAAIEPPASVWPAIAQRLGGTVTTLPARQGYWNSLALWRGLTAGAVALAAASLVVAVLPRTQPVPLPAPAPTLVAPPSGPIAVARLDSPAGGAAFIAAYDAAKHQLLVTPTAKSAPAGHSPQLWLLPAKGAPVPLGLFTGRDTLVVSAPPGVSADSQLAVSLEPVGGSPTGAPTGPVIAVGKLMRLG